VQKGLTLALPRVLKNKFKTNPKFHFVKYINLNIVPFESTAEEVSFEWSHHRISSTHSKVRTTLNVSVTNSGCERVEVVAGHKFF